MPSKIFRANILFAAITLLYSNHALAENTVSSSAKASGNVAFPFFPRLNLYAGTGSQTYGRGDALIPLFGSTNGIFYTDVDASRNNDNADHDVGLGVGVRIATNDDFMWGTYVFADRSRSHLNEISNDWTTINPGVEFMTNHWDGRLNVYIPTGDKQKTTNTVFGEQLGIASSVSFTGHNQYGELYNVTQEIGAGADADVGYTFTNFKRLRVHGGGYYFSPKNTTKIGGGEIGAEFPMNRFFTLEVADAYDRVQQNQATVSLRMTLGGTDKSSTPTVQDRILDPIYRHLGLVGTDTAVPVQGKNIATGQMILERSNIWFFSPSAGSSFDSANGTANCTYEHPCNGSSFTQTNANAINGISANANFYFTPGSYNIGLFSLPNGQSMYGRDTDYRLPASASSTYPTFVGELVPLGNNTLDSFALMNTAGTYTTAIGLDGVNNVQMNNLQIGALNADQGYTSPIELDNAQNIVLTNSTINAFTNGTVAVGVGIENDSSATLAANNIVVTNGSSTGDTYGLINNNSTVTLNQNNFTINAGEFGISLFNVLNGIVYANANNFTMNLIDNVNGSDTLLGVVNTSNGTAILTNNNFNIAMESVLDNNSVGGIVNNGGNVTASGNTFNLSEIVSNTGSTNTETGIENNGGTVNASNNTFSLKGYGSMTIIGFNNLSGTFNASNNTLNFLGSATTKTCTNGSITGSGNVYTGCV